MGFINWLNLRKYIKRGTDSEVARIGHVNAVYDALAGGAGGGVSEIIADGLGPYQGQVTIDADRFSTIDTDYKIKVVDQTTGFSLGIGVPYHEVIGTIQLAASNGTTDPILFINVNTAVADVEEPATWTATVTQPISGEFHINLIMNNFVVDYYRNGMFVSVINPANIYSINAPAYELLPFTGYTTGTIELVLSNYEYTGSIKRVPQSLTSNQEVQFTFHLILPLYNP
jgi:hypothetical protein